MCFSVIVHGFIDNQLFADWMKKLKVSCNKNNFEVLNWTVIDDYLDCF